MKPSLLICLRYKKIKRIEQKFKNTLHDVNVNNKTDKFYAVLFARMLMIT